MKSEIENKQNHEIDKNVILVKPTFTGELGYEVLNGTRKIGPPYAKSVIYI